MGGSNGELEGTASLWRDEAEPVPLLGSGAAEELSSRLPSNGDQRQAATIAEFEGGQGVVGADAGSGNGKHAPNHNGPGYPAEPPATPGGLCHTQPGVCTRHFVMPSPASLSS